MTEPAVNPRFLVDRSLGGKIVPDGLRIRGWSVVTLDDRYGRSWSQHVSDVDWIRDATANNECILTADTMIAKRPAEALVVWACSAKMFVLGRGHDTGANNLALILQYEDEILRWARWKNGPFVAMLEPTRIRQVRLARPSF